MFLHARPIPITTNSFVILLKPQKHSTIPQAYFFFAMISLILTMNSLQCLVVRRRPAAGKRKVRTWERRVCPCPGPQFPSSG